MKDNNLFEHLKDEKNFMLSFLAGTVVALFLSLFSLCYYIIKQDCAGIILYAGATILFSVLYVFSIPTYLHARKGLDEGEKAKPKKKK